MLDPPFRKSNVDTRHAQFLQLIACQIGPDKSERFWPCRWL
jgi:hypothetical protein